MSRRVRWMTLRALLTWTLVCLAPQTGLAYVIAVAEPPMVTEAEEPQVGPPSYTSPDEGVVVVRHHHGSRVRIGGPVVVERGERVDDAVAVLGSVTVRGEVTGSAVAVGGDVRVEEGASIDGEVVAVGGRIVTAPTARISGHAEQIAIDFPQITRIGPDGPDVTLKVLPDWNRVIGALAGASMFRLVSLLLIGLGVVMVFRAATLRAADQAAGSPLESVVIGLGLQVLLLPALLATCLALAVSVIGLPLVPVLLVVVCGVWLVGFCGAAVAAGRGALRLVGAGNPSPLAAFILGGLPFAVLTIGSRLAWWSRGELGGGALTAAIGGLVLEGLLWSVGAGALVLSWLRGASASAARPIAPPPPPTPAVPVQL